MSPENDNTQTYRFLLGKGGVGKSTLSAISALKLSRLNKKVLLVSLDPAHNLHDIFQVQLSEKPKPVSQNLWVSEVNHRAWIKRYLSGVQGEINRTYRYLTSVNLDQYFDIMKFSPGIEEYALLLALDEIIKKYKNDMEMIIFDMPPTALSLKFFHLPGLSIRWLEKLLELRSEIVAKRELITKIKMGKVEVETDKISKNLKTQLQTYRKIQMLFEDTYLTSLEVVINPEKLSIAEADEIIAQLSDMNIPVSKVLLNKLQASGRNEELISKYARYGAESFIATDHELLGIENLLRYIA